MPCNDITERIEIFLDEEDRLSAYSLRKCTCGRPIGEESLLAAFLTGKPLDDIAHMTPEALLQQYGPVTDIERFLALKHFLAVQAGCAVIRGARPGGPGAPCAVAEIGFDRGQTHLIGLLRVDAALEEIQACGPCTGCVSRGHV